jgi:Bacterial type III secretion protein (HrpB1_HrpK)
MTATPYKKRPISNLLRKIEIGVCVTMDPITKVLLEIALLGTVKNMDDDVAKIAVVLEGVGVDLVKFDLTRAALMYSRGTPNACVLLLEEGVLRTDPGNEIGLGLLTTALRQIGRSDWKRVAENVMSTAIDPIARRLAAYELAAA